MANIKEAGHFTLTFTFDDQDPELRFFNGTYDGTNQNLHIGAETGSGNDSNENKHHGYYDIDWTNESNLANYYINSPHVDSISKFNDDRDFIRNNFSKFKNGSSEFVNEKDDIYNDVIIKNPKEHNDHRLTTDLINGYSYIKDINPGTGTNPNINLLSQHFNRNTPSKNNKTFINELSPYLIAVRNPENQGNEYYCDKNDDTKGYQFAWLNGATMWTFPTSQEHGEGVDVTKHVFYRSDHPQHVDKNRLRTYSYSDWQWGTENAVRENSDSDLLMKNARVTWLGSADSPKYDSSLPDKPVNIKKISRTDDLGNVIPPEAQFGPVHRGHATTGNGAGQINWSNYLPSGISAWQDANGTNGLKQSWGTRKAEITVSFNSKHVSDNYARITPTETTISNLKVTVFIHYFRRHDWSPLEYSHYESKTIPDRGINGFKPTNEGSGTWGTDTGNGYINKSEASDAPNSSWSGNTNTLIKDYRFRSIARFIELGTVPFTHMAQSIMSTNGKILLKEIIENRNRKRTNNLSVEAEANYKKGIVIGPKEPTEQEIYAEVHANSTLFDNHQINAINHNNAYQGDSQQIVFEPKNSKEKWYIQSHDVCNVDNGNRFNRLYFKFDEDGIYPRYQIHSTELIGDEQTLRPTQNRTQVPFGAVAYIRSNPTDDTTTALTVGPDKGSTAALLNFTGQHRAISDLVDENPIIGYIVISSGKISTYTVNGKKIKGKNAITINESVPEVEYSTESRQKSVFGVISGLEDDSDVREYSNGSFVTVYEKSNKDRRLIVNSLGEGGIWVCNENGNLNNGDCITTSSLEGIGMKQDDDIIHNYTVAKITIDCSFTLNSPTYNCIETEINGVKYRKAFVSCTYHCG